MPELKAQAAIPNFSVGWVLRVRTQIFMLTESCRGDDRSRLSNKMKLIKKRKKVMEARHVGTHL